MASVWVCVTTRNEVETIGELVRCVAPLPIIVSDAASTDGTPEVARKAGAHVIEHEKRIGIGPALIEAWQYALDHGAERIAQLDAGGSHDPNALPWLLAESADVVIGSRFCEGGQSHGRGWRAWCSRLAAMACNLAQAGPWVHDWTSGYRVFTADAARRLLRYGYTVQMHGWQIETLGRARQEGMTIAEVPITYRAGRSSLTLAGVREAMLAWALLFHHM